MRVAVAGASGFVGSRLCPALEEAGHEVVALTRNPDSYSGSGVSVAADVSDPDSLQQALEGCDAAYYLVHSLDHPDFARRDADAAKAFGEAAHAQGIKRIIYLGGLGDDGEQLSEHLRSRREVEQLLGQAGVPVTTLRAGIIVGHGGISWEITRQLVEHLPAMVTPRWVHTRTQPIALADVVRYLVGVLEAPITGSRAFDIGGPEVLEYADMLRRVAAIEGAPLLVVPVPLLTPDLSSRWLALVTDVDTRTGRSLVDSMTNEVVVRDDSIRELVPLEPMGYDAAVRAALAEREAVAPEPRRRGGKAVATTALGAALLRLSLSSRPGSARFYALTAAVAATWVGGGLAEGGVRRAAGPPVRSDLRAVAEPVALGAAAFGAFYGAALVARRVPVLSDAVQSVLSYAHEGNDALVLGTTLLNGVAAEVFFRGGLFDALGDRHPVLGSTITYTGVTAVTRNPALVAAAAVMGGLFAAQRQRTGGVQASVLTHLTWSALMVRRLPRLFRPAGRLSRPLRTARSESRPTYEPSRAFLW